jgi:hypothetical protein
MSKIGEVLRYWLRQIVGFVLLVLVIYAALFLSTWFIYMDLGRVLLQEEQVAIRTGAFLLAVIITTVAWIRRGPQG